MGHSGHASDSVESVAKVPQPGHDVAANMLVHTHTGSRWRLTFSRPSPISRVSDEFSGYVPIKKNAPDR
jgi:hypothetical protein